jgi:hypothetical protein
MVAGLNIVSIQTMADLLTFIYIQIMYLVVVIPECNKIVSLKLYERDLLCVL